MPLLKDKVAIVTGGARGIGKAIVLELAKEGADIVFNYLKSKESAEEVVGEAAKIGRKAIAIQADVKDPAAGKLLIEKAKENFGRLDILVNNAGILKDKALMLMEQSDWNDVISTNLSGAYNLCRAAIVSFLKQKSGDIVNITSVSGITGLPRQVNYSASKAGIIGLTKALAKEAAPYNIRVNAVAPGFIETDMIGDMKNKEELAKSIPLGRFGRPEDVAKVVLFLLSDKSKYITGQIIQVDGGLVM